MLSTNPLWLPHRPNQFAVSMEEKEDSDSKEPQAKTFPGLKIEVEPGKKREKPSPMEHLGKFDMENFFGFLESLANAALWCLQNKLLLRNCWNTAWWENTSSYSFL